MAQSMQRTTPLTPAGVPRQTPGITAVGWLLICFAVIPLLFGAHEFDRPVLMVGAGMLAVGAVCLLIGRFRLRRRSAS